MQVLIVKIEDNKKGRLQVQVDNLSREDATDGEKTIADSLEIIISETIKSIVKNPEHNIVAGTRYSTPEGKE